MKTLHVTIIIILVIAAHGAGIAHGELVPKTLAKLYQEYQGKLIVLGQVMSVSENTAKNLTSYDIKILDYITKPQQASVITASAHSENKTIPVFETGDNVQMYLDKGLTGYEISPYSFKMDKKCSTWLGPSHLDFEPPYSAPASSTRFLDVNGNSINPSLDHEFVLQTDGIYTPLDSIGFEVYVSLNDKPNPIFHDTKQFHVQPCTYAAPTWKYTPTEDGNYTLYYKVIGGIYQDKIILDNASMTTGFTIEKSNVQSSKNTTNFIGNDLTPIILSPLKQFKSGITPQDVTCKESLQLVIKAEDHSPACVKLDAAYMLIKRGWAASESAYPGGDAQFVLHTNSTIIPAHLPRSSGLRIPYYELSRVINYTGFDGVYNETFPYRGTQKDYVLKPGSTGIITFKLEAVASEQQGQDYPIPLPKSLNLTNYAVFYHEITSLEDLSKYPGVTFDGNGNSGFMACSTGPSSRSTCIGGPIGGTNHIEAFVTDHPGVDVLFEPPLEVLPLGMNATSQVVTMMITADSNAPRGTYLVQLPSGGLDSFLLTVGDRPYHE